MAGRVAVGGPPATPSHVAACASPEGLRWTPVPDGPTLEGAVMRGLACDERHCLPRGGWGRPPPPPPAPAAAPPSRRPPGATGGFGGAPPVAPPAPVPPPAVATIAGHWETLPSTSTAASPSDRRST